jgi:hypothetical protein
MTIPPQPKSKLLEMTFALVPGGPEPKIKGFSNFIPFTSTLRSTFDMGNFLTAGAKKVDKKENYN